MKQCPKCQELNLDEAVVCSKCGAALNETQPPEQQAAGEAAASAENEVNSADNAAAPQRDISWMRFTAFLFPYFGILYSAALVAAKKEDEAKSIWGLSLTSFIVQAANEKAPTVFSRCLFCNYSYADKRIHFNAA